MVKFRPNVGVGKNPKRNLSSAPAAAELEEKSTGEGGDIGEKYFFH